jgi:hypothetical protein
MLDRSYVCRGLRQAPSGKLVEPYGASQIKGVILFTTRARRLALAVLAGVLFGLAGSAVANADAQTAGTSSSAVVVDVSNQSSNPVYANQLDWWT